LSCNILAPEIEEDGEHINYYDNGEISEIYYVKDGELDSIWTSYYYSGNLQHESYYKIGIDTGTRIDYFENGTIELIEPYNVKGRLEGRRLLFSEDGDTLRNELYEDGILIAEYIID